ncbi:S9 family peptidase [Chromobacterium sp. IIBBL 290-4]|uniref:S9 family peptidase n=1 Tax=Chromobacterium sp. IIBBL 290-4 TaxID=2953890 RepID=UPI0020B721FD|nr:S9 family peptidase [Chromobacterium sp. IIBBL 290-4]UTH74820.1 S9 family peptidase [Chromobacterium sp. IIBBL 290-4]
MKKHALTVLTASLLSGRVMAAEIPLQDFFRNPEQSNFTVSPDGKSVAFLSPWEKRKNIVVRRDGQPDKRVTAIADRDLAGYFWKGNDHLLYLKDKNGDENFHLYSVDLDSGETRDLTPFDGVRADIIDDLRDRDGEMLISMNKRNPEIFDVYHVDLKTGELRLEAENPGKVDSWVTDHDGHVRIAVETDGVNKSLLYRDGPNDAFRKLLNTDFRQTFAPLFFTFDNQRFYAASNLNGRDKTAIVEFDPKTGKEVKEVYGRQDVDVEELAFSHKRKVITCADYQTDKPGHQCFDAQTQALYDKLEPQLAGYKVDIVSADDNETRFVVRAWNDKTPGKAYLYDKSTDKLTLLAEITPWLKEDQMSEMRPVHYQSRDGLTINGYLTLPKGKEDAKDLPVIINPHGGPWARDSWRFNPEVQFFASRGWAVLQMNYRGSTGYGRQFWEASFKEWGGKMQDDVSDGVDWLVKSGVADPKKVCIYGGSYGGYATLSGITKTPELYRCAVDYVGVSNLFTFMKTIPPYWKPFLDSMYEMVGNPEKDKELLRERSPVFHVDRIQAPLLVLQGAKDPRVNINESNQIVDGLKKRGVEVEYIVKENEGHGFHNVENRFDAYGAMEKFFKKYLD